jgi:NAD-dependent SIR2 family protein deacetylase
MAFIDEDQTYEQAMHWIENASAILVIAGAGMSHGLEIPADEGWGDSSSSSHRRPPNEDVMDWRERYGDNAEKMWGTEGPKLLRAVVRGVKLQNSGYKALYDLLKYRNHFVWTSNIDHRFHTAGFGANKVYTPQGDLTLLQCSTPCGAAPAAWPALEPLLALMTNDAIDPDTYCVRADPEHLQHMPRCPSCRAPAYKHTRHNGLFTHQPHDETQSRLVEWLLEHCGADLGSSTVDGTAGPGVVILELGCGLSTPFVNRFPAEALARQLPARLIRINASPVDAQAPPDLVRSGRALSLAAALETALPALASGKPPLRCTPAPASPARGSTLQSTVAPLSPPQRLPRVPFAHDKIKWSAYFDKLRNPAAKPALM